MVAQYGDACNLFTRMGDDELRRKMDVLREHCERIGRPYEQIEKTTLEHVKITRDGRDGTLSPSAAVDHFGHLAELGVDQAIFSLLNVTELEPFDLLAAEIIPQVEKISTAGR